MELSKQEIDLFLILPGLWSKNFFSKTFLIFTKDINIDFHSRKWNYQNRKWNYFSHFQASDQKTFFYKIFVIWSDGFRIDLQNRKWNYLNRKWNYFSYFQDSDQTSPPSAREAATTTTTKQTFFERLLICFKVPWNSLKTFMKLD